MTKYMEKVRVLSAFLTLAFTDKICLQEFWVPKLRGEIWSKVDLALAKADQAREHLGKLDIHEPMGPERLHS